MHLIGDKLTVTGMKLGGFKEAHPATKENASKVLREISPSAGIILITQELAKGIKEDIEKVRKNKKVIVEIPDKSGGGEDFIDKLVKDVIGFDLKK